MGSDAVVGLFRYPLKGARGEALDVAEVVSSGFAGDRVWACVDGGDGTVGSPKHPGRWGRLLEIGTAWHGAELRLDLGGVTVVAGAPGADAAVSVFLGREVRLTREVPAGARLHRLLPEDPGMVPEWMAGLRPGAETVTELSGAAGFVDFAPVHVVTTGALAALAAERGVAEVAVARFRPNVVLDAERDPEPGAEVKVGEVVLRVMSATPRCVVPGLGQGPLPSDRALLSTLARRHRQSLPGLGRAACFGVYAEVLRPGVLHRQG